MTAIDILLDWLGCVQAQQTPLYLGQDELEHWPDGLLDVLSAVGLLHKASPANTLDCRGCAWGCHKPVQWYPQHPGSPPRAFILCDEEPAQGRITVQPERLQQWQASPESLAKWLADQVNDLSQAEILQVLPDLPLYKIVRLEGLIPTIDALALHRAMPTIEAMLTKPQESPVNRIYLNGDFWTVTFNGQTQQLKNTKGMQLIALLIQKQGNPCHVLELIQELNPAPPPTEVQAALSSMTTEQLEELGFSFITSDSGDDVLDKQAQLSIMGELRRIQELIHEAEELGDTEGQYHLENKRDSLLSFLQTNQGLGGRSRKTATATERARKSVQKRLSTEFRRIIGIFPDFGSHLAVIQTGTSCCYQPRSSVSWKFGPP